MLICSIVGARPNFMKIAPVFAELQRRGADQILVHTGQHYDDAMSAVFFRDLGLPQPDVFLGVGSGTHAQQTARIMTSFESLCLERQPGLVIVGGDVNSTLACALVAAKLLVPVAHIEAGLRSFDRSMPEELNRILTDHISDLLFTTEQSGSDNLVKEGIARDSIHLVGNCMIDSLKAHLPVALSRRPWDVLGLKRRSYALVTLHRPAAVDDPTSLQEFRHALKEIGEVLPLIFPVHPRTRAQIEAGGVDWEPVRMMEPLGYLDFLGLMAEARLVLTDSGGIQEETTALGVPCVTMRDNTERPVTLTIGTNVLAGTTRERIVSAARNALSLETQVGSQPPLWDGAAAVRIANILERWVGRQR